MELLALSRVVRPIPAVVIAVLLTGLASVLGHAPTRSETSLDLRDAIEDCIEPRRWLRSGDESRLVRWRRRVGIHSMQAHYRQKPGEGCARPVLIDMEPHVPSRWKFAAEVPDESRLRNAVGFRSRAKSSE